MYQVNISSPFTCLFLFALVNMMCCSYFVHRYLNLMRRGTVKILITIEYDHVYDHAWVEKVSKWGCQRFSIPKKPQYTSKSGPPTTRHEKPI